MLLSMVSDFQQPSARILEEILKDCFWGDYRIDADEALSKLRAEDEEFGRFLVARIIEQGRFPSAYLAAMFPEEWLREIMNSYNPQGRAAARASLVRAVLWGEVPKGVRQWPAA